MIRFAAVLVLLLNFTGRLGAANPRLIGYLPEYRLDGFRSSQLHGVTDLIFFSVILPADGRIPERLIAPSHLARLKELRKGFNGNVLLTVGGWERSAGFGRITATRSSRYKLIRRLAELCRKHRFNGVDYDWEHPKGVAELSRYAALVRETKVAFNPFGGLVTVAQAGWQDLGKELYNHADRIHLMAYDHVFPQATFDKSRADVERVIGLGCPPEKIALGVPFYGRNRKGSARTFAELNSGARARESKDLIDGFALNGTDTMQRKIAYARERGLAGLMIWELGQDAVNASALLPGIVREMSKRQR